MCERQIDCEERGWVAEAMAWITARLGGRFMVVGLVVLDCNVVWVTEECVTVLRQMCAPFVSSSTA